MGLRVTSNNTRIELDLQLSILYQGGIGSDSEVDMGTLRLNRKEYVEKPSSKVISLKVLELDKG